MDFDETLLAAIKDEKIAGSLKQLISDAISDALNRSNPNSAVLSALREYDAGIQRIEEQMNSIRNTMREEKDGELAAKEKTIDDLGKQLSEAQGELKERKRSVDQLNETVRELTFTRDGQKDELEKSAARITELDSQVEEKDAEILSLTSAKSDLINQLKTARNRHEPFEKLEEVYQIYHGIDLVVYEKIKRDIIPDKGDPVGFLSAGCQWDTILRFWDCLKEYCENSQGSCELIALLRVLDFFILQYNNSSSSPSISLMTKEAGNRFDRERHQKSRDCSSYDGTVERVLLPGIWSEIKRETLRKCVVFY